jgi:hypothetical protein
MNGAELFAQEAIALGLANVEIEGSWVKFDLPIPDGKFAGETRRIAAEVPADFPLNPPPGPHISPPTTHPAGAVHASALGADWVYWSRPAQGWPSDRTVRAWVRHVRSLFAQVNGD